MEYNICSDGTEQYYKLIMKARAYILVLQIYSTLSSTIKKMLELHEDKFNNCSGREWQLNVVVNSAPSNSFHSAPEARRDRRASRACAAARCAHARSASAARLRVRARVPPRQRRTWRRGVLCERASEGARRARLRWAQETRWTRAATGATAAATCSAPPPTASKASRQDYTHIVGRSGRAQQKYHFVRRKLMIESPVVKHSKANSRD